MGKEIVIIGGGPAGVTAAITARRYYPETNITLIRKEEKALIPCGIPYMFGTLDSAEKNLIPDQLLTGNNINLVIDEASSIDRDSGTVITSAGKNFIYDRLILALGSSPLIPSIPGVELNNVYAVRKDLEYLKDLSKKLDQSKDVVIIGGGFIGLEFADEFMKRGNLKVTIIELLPHCLLLACDEEICKRVENKLLERGVNINVGAKAGAISGKNQVEYVELESGDKIKADTVILGIGVKPNVNLALECHLAADGREGIQVDDFMRTSDENIFAIGDCAKKRCYLSGLPKGVWLASMGTTEARIAGANLFNVRRRSDCAIGIFSTCFGDLAVGSAGLTESAAREMGMDVVTGESVAPDKHPGSIPGAQELGIKLVFEKDTGLLIGGQVYGGVSVGEKINFIGALIQHKMRADEVCTFQMGTHPLLTASPIAYQLINAAQLAVMKLRKS
ncbi:MAG: FAD-dependent oxidoreductase [Bacteroidales bacterium]|nr:FAD-dependent oxidoreductase [Bacteroidales bacterium]